ncbi:unnamed protein product [Chrysoparadoxa australica]
MVFWRRKKKGKEEKVTSDVSVWKKTLDPVTGRHYWYDAESKKTTWTNPNPKKKATEEIDPRKRRKLYGKPPKNVQALPGNQNAHVWWESDWCGEPGNKVIGYMVSRYRLDDKEWNKKGSTKVEPDKTDLKCKDVQNDRAYRFTVATISEEGLSGESEPSKAVRPRAPLPDDWQEFTDPNTRKVTYKNVRTNQVVFSRPDQNPFYLPTELFLRFSPEEMDTFLTKFREYAALNDGSFMAQEDVVKLLPTLGEDWTEAEISQRLAQEGWNPKLAKDEPCIGYIMFVSFLWGIKKTRMDYRTVPQRVWRWTVALVCCLPRLLMSCSPRRGKIGANVLDLIEQDEAKRLGDWEKLMHNVVHKPYFRHINTGEILWTMPNEVKFFLSTELKQELLGTFRAAELEGFKGEFRKMDLDGSGSIDKTELTLLLRQFGEAVNESRLSSLMKEVDRDGSGEIDFDEFCIMMASVKNGKASAGWTRMKDKVGKAASTSSIKLPTANNKAGKGHGSHCLCGCRCNHEMLDQAAKEAAGSKRRVVKATASTRRVHLT